MTPEVSETRAVRRLACFVSAHTLVASPSMEPLNEVEAAELARAYYEAWNAWGKPVDTHHKGLAKLLYGDRPAHPGLLAQALKASLETYAPGWRLYITGG